MPAGFQAFGNAEGYVGSAAWSPTNLGSLLAWYHADDATASSWAPRGTADANRVATQSTASNRPTIGTVAGLNNKTAVQFPDDITDAKFMVTSAWSASLAQPTSVYASALQTGTSGNHYLFDGISGHRMGGYGNAARTQVNMFAGANVSASPFTAGQSRVMGWEFNGASSNIYVNAVTASITGDPGSGSATGLTIGNYTGQGVGNSGWSIRQMVVCLGVLSDADRALLMGFLGADIARTIGP